jgi:glutathione S-transferase
MTDVQNRTKTSTIVPITVYWLNESRADRILFVLEELELPYNIQKFERGSDKLTSAELKKIQVQ